MDFSFLNDIEIKDDAEIEELERKRIEEAEERRQERLRKHFLTESGVPLRYLNESLKTYIPLEENRKKFEWICGFVDSVKRGENKKNILYVSGKFGTGKTHIGCGMIRELGGLIVTALGLCIAYDSCRDFKATETRMEFLKRHCSQRLLIIDEVGKGIDKIEREIYPYMVNEFYGNRNTLVFLGNADKAEFDSLIGEAGADRMREVGVYMALTGESRRGQKK